MDDETRAVLKELYLAIELIANSADIRDKEHDFIDGYLRKARDILEPREEYSPEVKKAYQEWLNKRDDK